MLGGWALKKIWTEVDQEYVVNLRRKLAFNAQKARQEGRSLAAWWYDYWLVGAIHAERDGIRLLKR